MSTEFQDRHILITGAGKGIGREIALHLAGQGARIVAISRTREDLDSLDMEIGCQAIVADLATAVGAQTAAQAAGEVDLLVNNAGISLPEPFLDLTFEAFDATLAVNLRAACIISQHVARAWVARGHAGAIVNLSSQASQAALADHAAYCASKAGLDGLTRVMALELGPHGIRVNSVNPTVTLTPMAKRSWADPDRSDRMLAKIPLGRFAQPRDIAETVAYLLSDRSAMITGVALPVDGGFLAT